MVAELVPDHSVYPLRLRGNLSPFPSFSRAMSAAADGQGDQQPSAVQQSPGQTAGTPSALPAADAAVGPVRGPRGTSRHEPYAGGISMAYPRVRRASSRAPPGTVPAAVTAIEHMMSTPMKTPGTGCDLEGLRDFVEQKFLKVDEAIAHLLDGHFEAQE